MFRRKNICVIGGAGFIGSHIVDKLVKENKVLVIDNLSSGSKKNINRKAKFIRYDITANPIHLAGILRENKIEYLFHLAAEPYIPKCYEYPGRFFEVNAVGTLKVLLTVWKSKVKRMLYYSSSEVYGSCPDEFINEEFPTNPHSTYAVSKLAGDRLCFTMFKEHKIPVIILRQFNVFGERETHEYVIPEIIAQLSRGDKLKLGNIYAKRDFIYVEDAAEMAIELLEKGRLGEVYNLGTGVAWSIKELAEQIGKLMNRKPKIIVDKRRLRPFDVSYLRCDNKRIYRVIKSRPKTSLKEGLKKTIDYFYKYGWQF